MPTITCRNRSLRCDSTFFDTKLAPRLSKLLARNKLVQPDQKKPTRSEDSSHAKSSPGTSLVLDLRGLVWCDLLELASLVALAGRLSWSGFDPFFRVDAPQKDGAMGHLAAAGFFSAIETLGLKSNHTSAPGFDQYTFYAIRNYSSESEQRGVIETLLGAVRKYFPGLPQIQYSSLARILEEILSNALEHAYDRSDSRVWPRLVAVRRLPLNREKLASESGSSNAPREPPWQKSLRLFSSADDCLELAVVDVGEGIGGRLKERLRSEIAPQLERPIVRSDWDDLAVLRRVFKGGLTSARVAEGRGFGIFRLAQHVQGWNGAVSIRTGNARVTRNPGSMKAIERRGLPYLPGTQIRIVLPIENRAGALQYVFRREAFQP